MNEESKKKVFLVKVDARAVSVFSTKLLAANYILGQGAGCFLFEEVTIDGESLSEDENDE